MPDKELDVAMAVTRDRATGNYLVLTKHEEYRDPDSDAANQRYVENAQEVSGGKIEPQDFAEHGYVWEQDYEHGEVYALDPRIVVHAAKRELSEETGLDAEMVDHVRPYRVEQHDGGDERSIWFYPVLLETDVDREEIKRHLERRAERGEEEHDGFELVAPAAIDEYLTENELPAFERLDIK